MADRGGTVGRDWRLCICADGLDRVDDVRMGADRAGFEVSVVAAAPDLRARVAGRTQTVVMLSDAVPSWLRVVHDLRQGRTKPLILLVTDLGDRLELLTAVSAGVDGIARRSDPVDAVVASLIGLSRTGASVPRSLTRDLIDEVRSRSRHVIDTPRGSVQITDREWEILQLLLQGLTTREMADELFVAVGTVRSHVSALLGKLGVRSRSEAVSLLESR